MHSNWISSFGQFGFICGFTYGFSIQKLVAFALPIALVLAAPDSSSILQTGLQELPTHQERQQARQTNKDQAKLRPGKAAGVIYQPAHFEARINQVFAQHNLSGAGTVLVMIDDGCDYRHTDFIDDQGNTRIAYIFDMLNPAGANAPNNPYGVGTIFNEGDINTSLQNGGTPIAEERHGHGTATTGIAAGDGSGNVDNRFRGVADQAKIIVVKAYTRSFPAHGTQSGQTGVFSEANIITGLEFAADKIEELGLPGVAVVNSGTLGGPADGTSSVSQAMDAFIARGHTLVCGTGDEGGQDNHTSGLIAQGQTEVIEIEKGDAGNLRFSLWYSEDDRFDIEIQRPDTTTEGPFASPATENSFDDQFFADLNYFHRGKNQEFFGATSHRRLVMIDLFGVTGTYKVKVTADSIGLDGGFHAVLNPSFHYSNNRFLNPVVGHSMHDYASANGAIVPGDYVADNDWIDVDGIFRQVTGEGNPGEIWLGSSEGPTQDGRLGIDCAAPGEMIWSPYHPDSWYSSFRFNMIETGNELYGRQTAVSAANPLVAGLICLMLEANPNLTPQQIKSILQTTSRQDSFTGVVPNTTWGHGKLDALAAVQAALELSYVVTADANKLLDGVVVGGQLSSTDASDDLYLEFDPSPTTNPRKQIIEMIIAGESPSLSPSQFAFRMESKMIGGLSEDVRQTIRLWNQADQLWETVDERAAAILDENILLEPAGDPARFIHPITGEVIARLAWKSPAFSGTPFIWSIDLDEAVWRIVE